MEADGSDGFLIIGITPPDPVEDEADRIVRLLGDGTVGLIHLRHPDLTVEETAYLIGTIPEELHPKLTLHDHFELTGSFHIGGIHLNHRNPRPPVFPIDPYSPIPVFQSGLRISRSCHSLEEVEQSKGLDYVTLSPIFDSISKSGYRALLPEEKLPDLRLRLASAEVPVVALGGVTPVRRTQLQALGFSGMAMLGALWTDRNL